jgi:phosphopantothenoylcysteine decarboxylase/phosphopantothenate--cysteine ligase
MNGQEPAASALAGKTLLVGVCGGVAAYKCAGTVSRLRQAGADVHVIMTEAAQRFVAPLTFQAVSNNDVHTDMFAAGATWDVAHIGLVRKTALFLILNATANTLAKLAHGVADNLLTACVLATRKPLLIAPAMNTAMLEAAATQANILTLQQRGFEFIEPGAGFLACGELGSGRLADDAEIVGAVVQTVRRSSCLAGEKIVITAGPTREFLDPVRFLSNPSTGRMGFALAAQAQARGASVTLVSGPTELRAPAGVELVPVVSAREMQAAVDRHLSAATIVIGAAAVSDFRPASRASHKAKKNGIAAELELVSNPDIIAAAARAKPQGCFIVGFAAETEDLERNARDKLARKNLDCIVANRIGAAGSGFASEHNAAMLFWRDGTSEILPKASKSAIAASILERIALHRNGR